MECLFSLGHWLTQGVAWKNKCIQFSSVQSLSRVRLFVTPWITAHQAFLSITNSRSSLRLTSFESVMPSIHLILSRPLLLLPTIPPSIRVFSNESTLRTRWPKYWSLSFIIIPSKEIPRLISFRIDSLDLFAVQGTLKSLLEHHSSNASILQHSAFFTVQLSHPYMTTGKTIALTQFSSIAQSCPTLCDPMNRSTPGLPVHHYLLEFAQTHVHRVRDAIQPSHPWSSLSPTAPKPSQHQSLFQWINSSHEVARVDLLQNGLVGSPCSPRDFQEPSPKPQFKSISSLVLSLLQSPTLTSIRDHRKNHSLD